MTQSTGPLGRLTSFCVRHPFLVAFLFGAAAFWGVMVAPFDFEIPGLERRPIPVDAIPDIGEKQQIVFSEWMGRSPKDVENQVTYPLTALLQGTPGVKTIRSYSYFGTSFIHLVFEDRENFYETRSRILEKLSVVRGRLPEGVTPVLGPDATGLGQIFWYTLEGEGFSLAELRGIQDWSVRYALQSAGGVSEVSSVGGFVREYQIDLDPEKLRLYKIPLMMVQDAVRDSNLDIGAMSIDVNRVEYMIRGLGTLQSLKDIEEIVLMNEDGAAVRVKDVARVALGPALRRGILDKDGREAVGGVVVARFGENPLEVIRNVKTKIEELTPSLPTKMLRDGSVSRLKIVPFYDRSILIQETLTTLSKSLVEEILITILVVLIMVFHLRVSLLVSILLPLGVLMTFILMKILGVDSNIMSLSGIAIAIGAMVDMGIIITENLTRRMREAPDDAAPHELIVKSVAEVGPAVLTSSATIVVSFLPIFFMTGAEGKLFTPLAWTKTFAIVMSVVIALTLLPALSGKLLFLKLEGRFLTDKTKNYFRVSAALLALLILTDVWRPFGYDRPWIFHLIFVIALVGGILGFFLFLNRSYESILGFFLERKQLFMSLPIGVVAFGLFVWLGWDRIAPFAHNSWISKILPGLSREFMPPLDEGSFLYMPTTMAHASVTEISEVLELLDKRLRSVPEVESVVGKAGRVESALDPAPLNMIESMVTYKPKYLRDTNSGKMVRQWRKGIETTDDIWKELAHSGEIPGLTGAPKLQPIATRLVMLQTGLRSPMGLRIQGPTLEKIEEAGRLLEEKMKRAEGVAMDTVTRERTTGTAYLEIIPDRNKLATYGLLMGPFQEALEIAVGGKTATTLLDGRERYPVRLRYEREARDSFEGLKNLLLPLPDGNYVPLSSLAEVRYVNGPMVIKSENSFLVGYVLFDKLKTYGETDVVEKAKAYLQDEIRSGRLNLPEGVGFDFTGTYLNQVRSQKTLLLVVPISLILIFLIFYWQFRSSLYAVFIFSSVLTAFAGGMILLYFYGQDWFLNLSPLGVSLRDLFNIHPVHLSVAVWVGFLALFGVASNDGVVMGTYLRDVFLGPMANEVREIRDRVILAGKRRVLPSLMTTATTMIALIPILTSKGRGSDLMVPMAIPIFGGMLVSLVSIYVIPVLFAAVEEKRLARRMRKEGGGEM